MLKYLIAGSVIALTLGGAAHADCLEATSFKKTGDGKFEATSPYGEVEVDVDPGTASESDVRALPFTAARAKETTTNAARVICQYESKGSEVGASLVLKKGSPISLTGKGWSNDDCATQGGDVQTCAFH
ncbi:hypothetical protein [Pseudomonas sp. BW7P1]|uniref:hypothetical protein n=1 Tax=Pseudomonas TaxID=286 RepID=UPI0021ADD24C|nr:hypothetical protein [Pseudomonas sp. BW7P1]UWI61516.1 hypothetical protein NWV16_26140 [Pseudomonas sp. BW7P1]